MMLSGLRAVDPSSRCAGRTNGQQGMLESMPPFDELALRSRLAACPPRTRRAIVQRLLSVIRPFGRLDPGVIEPARFEQLADAVDAALDGSRGTDLAGIVEELGALPAVEADEEPEGVSFYTLGAVVELLYAAEVVGGEPKTATWALARASDVLGFADDELGTSGRHELLQWMDHSISAGSPADSSALATKAAEMAAELAEANG